MNIALLILLFFGQGGGAYWLSSENRQAASMVLVGGKTALTLDVAPAGATTPTVRIDALAALSEASGGIVQRIQPDGKSVYTSAVEATFDSKGTIRTLRVIGDGPGLTEKQDVAVHQGNSTLVCHAPTGSLCNDNDVPATKYEYGRALIQAYWEIAHGLNCHGPDTDPCYVMNGFPGSDQARWAYFYAMKESPRDATYREFVADILQYFNDDVGYYEYNDRWWVFNHHGLIGPDYSYTPCSFD